MNADDYDDAEPVAAHGCCCCFGREDAVVAAAADGAVAVGGVVAAAVVTVRRQSSVEDAAPSRCWTAGSAAPSHYDSRTITLISKLEEILQSRTTVLLDMRESGKSVRIRWG